MPNNEDIIYRTGSVTLDYAGYIPRMLAHWQPDVPWADHINKVYAHGGGWDTQDGKNWGHVQGLNKDLIWRNPAPDPGEPEVETSKWLIEFYLHDHVIRLHEHAWVSVEYPDGRFEVSRMD